MNASPALQVGSVPAESLGKPVVHSPRCVSFRRRAEWFSSLYIYSYIFSYTHVYSLAYILFYYGSSQDTEYSSLYYAEETCCLFILREKVWGLPWRLCGKEPACHCRKQETRVPSPRKDPLEEEVATHSSILAWRIPWTEEPGGLYSPWGRKKSQTPLSN